MKPAASANAVLAGIVLLLIATTGNSSAQTSAPGALSAAARGNPSTPFTDNGDGTVTDRKTGLMWQKDDDGQEKKWADAGPYCARLSLGKHSDWRLPGMEDLVPLWENAGDNLEIRRAYFPKMKNAFYWSSTKCNLFSFPQWWGINFYGQGVQGAGASGNLGMVRCVRLRPKSAKKANP
jgi:Protein of unknown function (DUF1566)